MERAAAQTTASTTPWGKKILTGAIFVAACVLFSWVSDYNWATGTGNLCLILFLAANVYLPAKWLRKRFRFPGVQPFFNWLLRWHCLLNALAFAAAVVHCRTTNWANVWLWVSLVLMGLLTLNGFVMRLKYPPRLKRGLYFLHTQQIVFICLLYAMMKGHYMFMWLPP